MRPAVSRSRSSRATAATSGTWQAGRRYSSVSRGVPGWRIVFSILTANTDDHLRNHAFLRERTGWTLSPAYDLNPNPDNPRRLSTLIDFDDSTASIETALSVSGYFRLSAAEAVTIVGGVERATSHWRREAAGLGLPRQQVDRMALAYETPERQTAKALPYSGLPDIP
jgi:serine/threonine-protein kinase HipA